MQRSVNKQTTKKQRGYWTRYTMNNLNCSIKSLKKYPKSQHPSAVKAKDNPERLNI